MKTSAIVISCVLACASAILAADPPATRPTTRPTARQLVERIRQNTHIPWNPMTVDTFKAGNPDTEVTGIVTTHLATLEVLQKAAAAGKNFVISHEPIFYNHLDRTEPLEGDAVLAEKRAFIEKHGLILFRFHDHWHRRQPDGVNQGVIKKIGWEKYLQAGELPLFTLPATTLKDLADDLKTKLGATVVRVVGKPDAKFTKATMLPGAAGSAAQIKMLERDDVEVLLIGETPEWETVEYVRDAITEGKSKALVILGHANSEEAGMQNCAEWLKTFIPEVPVQFIPAGDPFWTAGATTSGK